MLFKLHKKFKHLSKLKNSKNQNLYERILKSKNSDH